MIIIKKIPIIVKPIASAIHSQSKMRKKCKCFNRHFIKGFKKYN